MLEIEIADLTLYLLPQKAIYIPVFNSLLLSDVHLGKAETFQRFGIPIPRSPTVNTLRKLEALCDRLQPTCVFILGDLFHSPIGLSEAVISEWNTFIERMPMSVQLIVGNHDRSLFQQFDRLNLAYEVDAIDLGSLILSHEPVLESHRLNICGHLHPYVRLQDRLDALRLPCFYWEKRLHRLTLPPFGEFTGGYDVRLTQETTAYVIAEDAVIPVEG